MLACRIERAANFAGSALLAFATSESVIGEHHYALYALIAATGIATILLAHTARRKNRL